MPTRRSDSLNYTLASNASATGSAVAIPGGEYVFTATGTIAGATISLQCQSPKGTWSDVQIHTAFVVKTTGLPFAQTGISLPAGNVRMASAGGTPSGLNANLTGLG